MSFKKRYTKKDILWLVLLTLPFLLFLELISSIAANKEAFVYGYDELGKNINEDNTLVYNIAEVLIQLLLLIGKVFLIGIFFFTQLGPPWLRILDRLLGYSEDL